MVDGISGAEASLEGVERASFPRFGLPVLTSGANWVVRGESEGAGGDVISGDVAFGRATRGPVLRILISVLGLQVGM
jgi:hypothetical protein